MQRIETTLKERGIIFKREGNTFCFRSEEERKKASDIFAKEKLDGNINWIQSISYSNSEFEYLYCLQVV